MKETTQRFQKNSWVLGGKKHLNSLRIWIMFNSCENECEKDVRSYLGHQQINRISVKHMHSSPALPKLSMHLNPPNSGECIAKAGLYGNRCTRPIIPHTHKLQSGLAVKQSRLHAAPNHSVAVSTHVFKIKRTQAFCWTGALQQLRIKVWVSWKHTAPLPECSSLKYLQFNARKT